MLEVERAHFRSRTAFKFMLKRFIQATSSCLLLASLFIFYAIDSASLRLLSLRFFFAYEDFNLFFTSRVHSFALARLSMGWLNLRLYDDEEASDIPQSIIVMVAVIATASSVIHEPSRSLVTRNLRVIQPTSNKCFKIVFVECLFTNSPFRHTRCCFCFCVVPSEWQFLIRLLLMSSMWKWRRRVIETLVLRNATTADN